MLSIKQRERPKHGLFYVFKDFSFWAENFFLLWENADAENLMLRNINLTRTSKLMTEIFN